LPTRSTIHLPTKLGRFLAAANFLKSKPYVAGKSEVSAAILGGEPVFNQEGTLPDFLVTPGNMDSIYLIVKKQERMKRIGGAVTEYYQRCFTDIDRAFVEYDGNDVLDFKRSVAGLLSAIAAD